MTQELTQEQAESAMETLKRSPWFVTYFQDEGLINYVSVRGYPTLHILVGLECEMPDDVGQSAPTEQDSVPIKYTVMPISAATADRQGG